MSSRIVQYTSYGYEGWLEREFQLAEEFKKAEAESRSREKPRELS